MISALLLVVALLATMNLINIRAWEKQSKEATELINRAVAIIKEYEAALEEVEND